MQHCGHCGQAVLTTHDLTQCYHCRKQLCPSCERNSSEVVICKQCITLRLQGKETLIHKLVYQLWLMGFQVVEREVDKLSARRYTEFQHYSRKLGVSVTIAEALDE